jgi:hypothetical protein
MIREISPIAKLKEQINIISLHMNALIKNAWKLFLIDGLNLFPCVYSIFRTKMTLYGN